MYLLERDARTALVTSAHRNFEVSGRFSSVNTNSLQNVGVEPQQVSSGLDGDFDAMHIEITTTSDDAMYTVCSGVVLRVACSGMYSASGMPSKCVVIKDSRTGNSPETAQERRQLRHTVRTHQSIPNAVSQKYMYVRSRRPESVGALY
jgi:hypothetical protein